MCARSLTDRLAALHNMLGERDPFVILLQVTDGPLPTLLTDPGMNRPWSTKHRNVADRTLEDLRKDSRVIKCEVMRASEALKYLTKQG